MILLQWKKKEFALGKAYNDNVQHEVRNTESRVPVTEHVDFIIEFFHIAFLSQDIITLILYYSMLPCILQPNCDNVHKKIVAGKNFSL